jgi:hypothetical protein
MPGPATDPVSRICAGMRAMTELTQPTVFNLTDIEAILPAMDREPERRCKTASEIHDELPKLVVPECTGSSWQRRRQP